MMKSLGITDYVTTRDDVNIRNDDVNRYNNHLTRRYDVTRVFDYVSLETNTSLGGILTSQEEMMT